MSMVVKNNISAQMVLGELNKSNSSLKKSLEKVSSGQKINSAQDDASGYAISEKMRVQLRSLDQDKQNVQNASTLFKIADGGTQNIVEELRSLKELAINAANDTNTDSDRATIQKEFTQKMANINDIATMTNYNGITLLDGTWARQITGSSGTEIEAPPYTTAYKSVTEPTGAATSISGSSYTITSDGVYSIAAGFTGTITINAKNVKLTQADSSAALSDVSIVGPSGGNANLWIDGLNISNSSENIFKFQGSNNVLSVKGTNILKENSSDKAAINVGGGLTVQGNDTHSLTVTTASESTGAAIGSDGGESTNTGDISIVNLNLTNAYAHYGSVIGSGGNGGYIGKITVENSTVDAKGYYNAIIGSGHSSSHAGDIWIVDSTIKIGEIDGEQGLIDTGIGSGFSDAVCGDIYILDSKVTIHNSLSACIGAGDAATCGNIFISASEIAGQSDSGACVGSGRNGSTAGDITITNATAISHKSPDGAAIGTGANGVVGKITVTQSSLKLLDASESYSDDTHTTVGIGRGRGGNVGDLSIEIIGPDKIAGTPLKIHHGTEANQATNFFIEDMHTKSLGTGDLIDTEKTLGEEDYFINKSDEDRYYALSYDSDLQAQWLKTLNQAQGKTIDDISVTTKDKSNIAIRVLDGALDYALNEATNIGAYLQRLEYTEANVTTMSENVQAAESIMRDADMAKEMTEYTKNNVITQAAQSMLAQANQSSSQVLSLLQ